MRSRCRKLTVTLTILTILFSLAMSHLGTASPATTPVEVDVFTQKQPYNGTGPNAPSDAFGPEENVALHALVTYNKYPLDNTLVAFNIKAPNNASFTLSSRTNLSGIATVNFTILTPPINISETDIFGNWVILGSVMVEDQVFQDSLTFKVDWIVKLLSVKTIDENLTYRNYFGRGGEVGLEITLRSIAMTLRNTTLALAIQDELGIVVNCPLIANFSVQPDNKTVFLYCKAALPVWTHVGTASILITALTALVSENGVPYCPSISTEFYVTGTNPLKIDYHDAAVVTVLPSTNPIKLGQSLTLRTLVRNEGTVNENFSVSTYFDSTLLGTFDLTMLQPYSTQTFEFNVDNSLLTLGNHTIKTSIPAVPKEADLTDNEFIDIIQVKPKTSIIHDIAITNIQVSKDNVLIGDTLQIKVTIANKGNISENFSVNVYYNSSLIESRLIEVLEPADQITLTFVWNTSSVSEGFYQISASTPLPIDTTPADNTFYDGIVQVKAKPLTHDVAILNVQPSSNTAYIGDTVDIAVTVENLGDTAETFNVTAYYNTTKIQTIQVDNLQPQTYKTLTFQWNTQNTTTGNYIISATATPVTDEENLENNNYIDGTVQIKNSTSETPDIAVLNVIPWSRLVYIGDTLNVNVTIKNNGTQTESFDITLYYNQTAAMTLHVDNLAADTETTIPFNWDTTDVHAANYTLSAYATPLAQEENTNNNQYIDGTVKFITPTKGLSMPELFYWFLLLLILLIFFILIIFWLYRRREKSKSSFYSGWTAWYYGYDLRSKLPKPKT
jgi:CARDB